MGTRKRRDDRRAPEPGEGFLSYYKHQCIINIWSNTALLVTEMWHHVGAHQSQRIDHSFMWNAHAAVHLRQDTEGLLQGGKAVDPHGRRADDDLGFQCFIIIDGHQPLAALCPLL